MKRVDAILTADWHIRADVPICRVDDFLSEQKRKVQEVFKLADKLEAPIIIAGDIGHKSQWPAWLIYQFGSLIMESKASINTIPGQHDLPQHRLKAWHDSALGILNFIRDEGSGYTSEFYTTTEESFIIRGCEFVPFPYGKEIEKYKGHKKKFRTAAVAHQMTIQNEPLWPGQEAPKAKSLLKKFPCYDLILTGDNHQAFVEKYEGRLLVNPGSLTRQTASQANHKPRVYLWNAERNEVEPWFFNINPPEEAISREHIDTKEERDERIASFIKYIEKGYDVGLSFRKNIEEFFKKNRVRKAIKDKVMGVLDE